VIQFQAWPPPDWTEVVITWNKIIHTPEFKPPQKIYEWCDEHASPGRYHVHGWKSTEGFAFRFENKGDAIMFALKWS
jgi:hypothetical protein